MKKAILLLGIVVGVIGMNGLEAWSKTKAVHSKGAAKASHAQPEAVAKLYEGVGKKAKCTSEKGAHAELVKSLDPLITCFKFDANTGLFTPSTTAKNFVSVKNSDDGVYTATCRIPVVNAKKPNKKTQEYKYSYMLDAQGRLVYFKGNDYKIGSESARKTLAKKLKLFKHNQKLQMASKGFAVKFKYDAEVGCIARAVKTQATNESSDRMPASVKKNKVMKKEPVKVKAKAAHKAEPKVDDWQ